ncbi:hypothetical protein DUT91_16365 [Phyllobacterium salinisoli]|uniref:Uncharacterized protein n=1 Tax=Phyllobacterium salinisoli TaxID=1899321 RepID=A0A368K1K9_9HYPH|nr:hypothetical protein DUT91_16365 [Phyllobacterium salinisoli]
MAGLLSLAAAPAFAVMAMLSGLSGEAPAMLCSTTHGAWQITGMATMYGLMALFHASPWLRLISHRRSRI